MYLHLSKDLGVNEQSCPFHLHACKTHTKKMYFQHQCKIKMKICFKNYEFDPSKHSINSYNILHLTKRKMIFANTDLSQKRKTFRK